MIFPLLLFVTSSIIGGMLLLVLALGGLFVSALAERRIKAQNLLKELLKGLRTKILDQPFLFDSSLRCKVSGRMMPFSTPVAGTVYKYFNLIILAMLLFSFFGLFEGARLLGFI